MLTIVNIRQPTGSSENSHIEKQISPIRKKINFVIAWPYTPLFRKLCAERMKKVRHVQGRPKNWTCLSIDNSSMVSGRKTCDMSKASECCKE